MAEAESHQNVTAGWWPLSDAPGPAFFAYAYPQPDGFRTAAVRPEAASFDDRFGEFLLPYDPSAGPQIRMRPSFSSCSRPTRPAPTWAAGTAVRSSRPSCLDAIHEGRGA